MMRMLTAEFKAEVAKLRHDIKEIRVHFMTGEKKLRFWSEPNKSYDFEHM